MTCLKCGRETDQTFCEKCRSVMEQYPVKPGSIVLLPKGRKNAQRSSARRAAVTLEMQIAAQKKAINRLLWIIGALIILLMTSVGAAFKFASMDAVRPIGQNYSTVTVPSGESEGENPTDETFLAVDAPVLN